MIPRVTGGVLLTAYNLAALLQELSPSPLPTVTVATANVSVAVSGACDQATFDAITNATRERVESSASPGEVVTVQQDQCTNVSG